MTLLKTKTTSNRLTVRNELNPGDLEYITYLHGDIYSNEYGFDSRFEAYVAAHLERYFRRKADREKIWIVEDNGEIKGSIAVVRFSKKEAQLSWFLLHPDIRGKGMGKALLKNAIHFSKISGYSSIFLWAIGDLKTNDNLYNCFGFQLTKEREHELWGKNIIEQRYDMKL